MKKNINLSMLIILLYSTSHYGQCSGNNTFVGTVSNNWYVAANWSNNCVPSMPVNGILAIAANCILMDTITNHFDASCHLVINEGITLSVVYGISDLWSCGDVLEYEGQSYGTVQIGDQCWFAQNLNVGNMLSANVNQTNNNVIEKYCMDDSPLECAIYGGLYQWNEAMNYNATEGTRGLCPTGWHLPSETEWYALENALPGLDLGSRLAGNAVGRIHP